MKKIYFFIICSLYLGLAKSQVCDPTITASDTIICSSNSVTLTANGAASYTWMPSGQNSSIIVDQPSITTIYTLVASSGTCVSSATIQINVDTPPFVDAFAFSNTICAGSTTSLSAAGATSYYWSPANSVNDSLAQSVAASPTVNTTYTVIGYNGTCQSSAYVTLNVIPSPSPSFTIQPDVTPQVWNIYPTCTGGVTPYTYTWDWGDGSPNSNVAYPSHTYTVAGTYDIYMYVTDANGCGGYYHQNANVYKTANSNSMIQVNVVNLTTGLQQLDTNNDISIFPNPATEKIYINSPFTEKELTAELFDVTGKLVLSEKINSNSFVDVSSLNNGMYTLTIKTESKVINKKLSIVK